MRPSRAIGLLLLAGLGACGSDKVQWAFVSNPGGSFGPEGGAVIVIRITSAVAAGLEGAFLRVLGYDETGPVAVLLPLAGDFAVLDRGSAVELRSPALSFAVDGVVRPGRVVASGAQLQPTSAGGPAALRLALPDSSVVHPSALGPGVLHVAAAGTLLILESLTGVVVFGERAEPEVLGLSVTLTTTPQGDRYALLLPDNRLRFLVAPPLPRPEQRLVFHEGRNSIGLLGPTGTLLAELPAEAVTLRGGVGGVFLEADLPAGLPGEPVPMRLLMAADNRYLLRVNE